MPYDYNDAMYEASGFVDEYLSNLEPEFRKHSNIEGVLFTKLEQRQIEVLHDHLTETLANILFRLNAHPSEDSRTATEPSRQGNRLVRGKF